MQVQITGHHVEITPGLRSFVTAKLSKIEDYYPKVRKVTVVLTVEKYRHTAEIHFHAEGVEMSAKKTTKDMYASVEEALAAIAQQAAKRKDRIRSQNARRKGSLVVKRGASKRSSEDDDGMDEPAVVRPKVVRSRAKALKPMRIEDAIAVLEAGKQPFLMFKDAASGETQLLFRRDDGNYGLMEA
jgi:putative sigma-54 modulation protein